MTSTLACHSPLDSDHLPGSSGSLGSPKGDCRSVLVVEDDHDTRVILREGLEAVGYQVYSAADGRQGIELLSKIPRPCLILLDQMMPIMSGEEFLREKRKKPEIAPLPVLIFSAMPKKIDSPDVVGFMKKPLRFDDLYDKLGSFCA